MLINAEEDREMYHDRRFLRHIGDRALPPLPGPVRAGQLQNHSVSGTSQFSSAKGWTLVEVVMAVALIAVFSVGIAMLAITVVTANAQAKATDIAVLLAHDRLEAIRNAAYPNITSANFPAEGYGSITIGSPPQAFPDFQRSVSIQDNTPTADVKRVVVTVSWRGGSVSKEMLVGR